MRSTPDGVFLFTLSAGAISVGAAGSGALGGILPDSISGMDDFLALFNYYTIY